MFVKSALVLAAAAGSVVAAPVVARGGKQPPAGWAYDYLEDYMTYHTRYLALECYQKHDTSFFSDCCSPLLKDEKLSSRPDYCTPSADRTAYVASSLSVKYSGAQQTGAPAAQESKESEYEEYCETDSSSSVAAASATASPTAAYKPAAVTESPAAAAASPSASPSAEASKAGQEYHAPAPSPTTTSTTPAWTPEPTTQAAAPQTTQQSSGGGDEHTNGQATYFTQGGNAGACGAVHGDYDMIAAIDARQWGSSSFGSGSSTCGRMARVTNTANGKTVVVQIADVCPTCRDASSLDLSVGAFQALGSLDQGVLPISWSWA